MLTVFGTPYHHCDGLTRRHFLTAGALSAGGLTLADLLRAEELTGVGKSEKAVINVHLDGGPPQMDMIDMKPDAPVEIRGEFKPVATTIPGFQICELMPKIAAHAHKFSFVRSLVGSAGAHDAFQCQSGWPSKSLRSMGGYPAMGCVVSRLKGSERDVAPSFVDLMQGRPLVRNSARPGFLGPAFKAFRPDISQLFKRPLEEGMKKELKALGAGHSTSLNLNVALDADRLNNRARLLNGLDRIRRDMDHSGMMDAMDRFTQQAAAILTSGKFASAMDLSQEDPKTLERYTPATDHGKRFVTAESPMAARKFLLARRLVEAGVRVVSISISDFDTHSKNFPRMRQVLPTVDQGLHALISDLEERGMIDNVTIVAWGEFGRTPRVDNKTGGRHHWPAVGPALLTGGGMRTGQIIGGTDRHASSVVSRPVTYQDVFATLYHNLGIDINSTTLLDPQGRPQYLVDRGQVLQELV